MEMTEQQTRDLEQLARITTLGVELAVVGKKLSAQRDVIKDLRKIYKNVEASIHAEIRNDNEPTLFDYKKKPTTPGSEWRELPITKLKLSSNVEQALRGAKLWTLGQVVDFRDENGILADIAGVGAVHAATVDSAIGELLSTLGVKTEAPGPVTPIDQLELDDGIIRKLKDSSIDTVEQWMQTSEEEMKDAKLTKNEIIEIVKVVGEWNSRG